MRGSKGAAHAVGFRRCGRAGCGEFDWELGRWRVGRWFGVDFSFLVSFVRSFFLSGGSVKGDGVRSEVFIEGRYS